MNKLSFLMKVKVKILAAIDTVRTLLNHYPDLESFQKEASEYRNREIRKLSFCESLLEGFKGKNKD